MTWWNSSTQSSAGNSWFAGNHKVICLCCSVELGMAILEMVITDVNNQKDKVL